MELSILVAKIMALTYIAAGFAALRGKISFSSIVEEFEKSAALTFITGFIALIVGMLLVQYHNRWTGDWTILVTMIGWLSLLEGLAFIAFPGCISFFRNWYKNTKAWGIFMIAIGLLFGYFGFLS